MSQRRNLVGLIVFLSATEIALVAFKSALLGGIFALACLYYAFAFGRQILAEAKAAKQETEESDNQLHANIVSVHNLAFAKLAGNNDHALQALRAKVIELLVEAGKHLGNPQTNTRVVYGSDFFLNWNKEGLALVEQARLLIESYKPVLRDRAGGELH